MRNKVTAKGHVGVRKTHRWKKKKQSWCWKNWDVNRDAQVSHDAADRRCEAAAGGGGNDAPVKIINHVWHRRSRLARQRGVGGLSPANHTRLGVFSNAQSLIFRSTGLTPAQQTEKRHRQSHFLAKSEIIWDYHPPQRWGGDAGVVPEEACAAPPSQGVAFRVLEVAKIQSWRWCWKKKFNRRHCRR